LFINPEVLKTAAFLVETDTGDLVSSAFFVRMPLNTDGYPQGYAHYAVTTRHSLKRAPLSIRLNETWGGIHDEPTETTDWIPHPEIDIAILPISFSLKEYDVHFVDDVEIVKDKHHLLRLNENPNSMDLLHRYGAGDEVFSVGLFPGHPGENMIHPAARFGHIALVPVAREKIMADLGKTDPVTRERQFEPIEAFLVEMSAMEGQSGSPVFLRPWIDQKNRREQRPISELDFLIGMIQGFYSTVLDGRIQSRKVKLTVDAGMAIVIPSRLIRAMLMEESLVKERARKLAELHKEREDKRPKPRPASLPPKEQEFTKDSFTDSLKRASRKISV
jgi:hypothetical protein